MSEDSPEIRHIHWSEMLPFTQIFRTFRIAVQPGQLLLGLGILFGIAIWGTLLGAIWKAAGQTALEGEIRLYTVTTDFPAARAAFLRGKNEAFVSLVRDRLDPGKTPEELTEALEASRAEAFRAADDRLEERFKELIDRDARAEKEADALDKYSDEQQAERDAELDRLIAASRSEKRAIADQLDSLRDRSLFAEWLRYEGQYLRETFRAARGLRLYAESDFEMMGSLSAIESAVAGLEIASVSSVAGCLCMMARGFGWMVRTHGWFALFFWLGVLAIGSLLGGAMARIAAMNAARDERIPLGQALRFSRRKFTGFFTTPILLAALFLFLAIALWVGGVLGSIPYLGDLVGGLFFFLALIVGGVMALAIVGFVAGASLMWPTIAVEGSDSFDAISRSYSYVLARPWRAIFYAAVATVYGAFCVLFVRLFIWLALACTHLFVGSGTGLWADRPDVGAGATKLDVMWTPPTFNALRPQTDPDAMRHAEPVGSLLVRFWVYVVVLLLYAFIISFYLSGSTVIYYLLRRDEDATDIEDVYLDEDEELAEEAPAPDEAGKPAEPAGTDDTTEADSEDTAAESDETEPDK